MTAVILWISERIRRQQVTWIILRINKENSQFLQKLTFLQRIKHVKRKEFGSYLQDYTQTGVCFQSNFPRFNQYLTSQHINERLNWGTSEIANQ